MIHTGLLIAAVVLAILAAIGVPSGRVSLLAGSLACYELTALI